MEVEILNINEIPEIKEKAAEWFSKKWGISKSEYLKSMSISCGKSAVPQWYIALSGNEIVGGVGVIENDFHDRKDLTPNICALYVEENYRLRGIAGRLLNRVCGDMAEIGVDILYLITEHTSFYERYGWKFLCMVKSDDELMRMYIHKI